MKNGSTITSMHIFVHAKHKLHCLLSFNLCSVLLQAKPNQFQRTYSYCQ